MRRQLTRFLPGLSALWLALACLALYIITLAPDVLSADNGELQRVAAQLSLAHPPGFPLYTLLAHVVTRLWLNTTPAYAVNLFSAITSAATVGLVYLAVYRISRSLAAAAAAGLSLATATTFWAQATTANIRSLTGLFAALGLVMLLRLEAECALSAPRRATVSRLAALCGLILGLGITHHLSLAFMGAIWLGFVLWTAGWRSTLRMAVWVLPGALPLLYLPWRDPTLRALPAFGRYVLGLGFGGDFFYFTDPVVVWERLKVMGNVFTLQFTPGLLVGMGLGLLWLLRYRPRLAFLLGGSWLAHTLITATYRAPQTVEYMLPAYAPMAIALGAGVSGWVKQPGNNGGKRFGRYATLFALILAVWQGSRHYSSFAFLHTSHDTRDYTQELLRLAPPDSVLLANWHWATPLWYLQQVEGQRPDVNVAYVYPTGAPYAQTWAERISAEFAAGRPVIATNYDEQAYQSLPVPDNLGQAFLFNPQPRTTLPAGFQPLNLNLEWGVRWLGYRLEPATLAAGDTARLTLAWTAPPGLPPFSIFAQALGADGRVYAQQDRQARYRPDGINLTQWQLTPRPGSTPGDYPVVLGAYHSTGRYLHTPDGAITTPLGPLHITPSPWRPITRNPLRHRQIGRTLVGYDWDLTLPDRPRLYVHWQDAAGYYSETLDGGEFIVGDMRLRATDCRRACAYVPLEQGLVWLGSSLFVGPLTPGATLSAPQTLAADRPILRDIAVSVTLIGYADDGYHWDWQSLDNGVPALGAIPTLKWIAGSRVRDPHWLAVNAQATGGQTVAMTLQFYDAFTNRPLAVLDEGITGRAPWIPLGQTTVR